MSLDRRRVIEGAPCQRRPRSRRAPWVYSWSRRFLLAAPKTPTGLPTKFREKSAHAGVRVVRLAGAGSHPARQRASESRARLELEADGRPHRILELKAGDRFEFECEIVNESSAPLRWANEALTAEMCILRGTYAPSLGRAWSSLTF
jgi:hypothetical protein